MKIPKKKSWQVGNRKEITTCLLLYSFIRSALKTRVPCSSASCKHSSNFHRLFFNLEWFPKHDGTFTWYMQKQENKTDVRHFSRRVHFLKFSSILSLLKYIWTTRSMQMWEPYSNTHWWPGMGSDPREPWETMVTTCFWCQVESPYLSESFVRGTGESSKAVGVEDAIRVILVASQVVTGNKVTKVFENRHDSTSVTDFDFSRLMSRPG